MTLDMIKRRKDRDIVNAIILIILVSVFVLSNFFTGFILPLFILIFSIAFAISVVFPRSGVYAVIFLTFIFERFFTLQSIVVGRHEYKIYFLDILLVAIFAGTFFYLLRHPEIRKRLKRLRYTWFIVFIVLVVVHFAIDILIFNASTEIAFSSFKYYVFYPMLYFVMIALFNQKGDMETLFKFIIVSGIGVLFFLFYGIVTGGGLWTEFTPLSTGGIRVLAFTHAFYLLISFLILLVYVVFSKSKNIGYYILLALWMIGIMGSMMRHLWIGAVISVIMMYILLNKDRKYFFKKVISKYAVIVSIIFLSVIYFSLVFSSFAISRSIGDVNKAIYERASSFLSFDNDESFSWRTLVWKESAKEYLNNPLYGVGLGQNIYVEQSDYRDIVEVRNIHNSWLVLLFQLGIVVCGILIFAIYEKTKILLFRHEKDWVDVSLIILMLNYIVVALFQPYFETNMLAIFFWIIFGLTSAKIVINQNASKRDENFRNQ